MRRLSNFHRVVLAIGVLLVIAFGGYAVYWHNMAVSLRAGLEPWATARRAEGYRVAWQTAETEGFPFAFAFRFTAVKLGADRPAPADFFGPVVVARTAPWDLRHWTFTAPQGGNISSALGLAGFDMHDIAGSVELGEPRGVTVDANAAGFNGTGLARGTTIASVSAHLQLPPTPPLGHRDVAFDGALQLKDLKLASSLPGFGDTISDISFSLQLKGAVPPGAMTTALMRWRDDGGTVELRYARLHWGSLLVAMGWIGLVMLASRRYEGAAWLRRLSATGQMAFTNYLMQTILCTTLFYGHGLGWYGYVDRVHQLVIAIVVCGAELAWSAVWLRYFRFGPFEWLWRSLTYRRFQPMRRQAPQAIVGASPA